MKTMKIILTLGLLFGSEAFAERYPAFFSGMHGNTRVNYSCYNVSNGVGYYDYYYDNVNCKAEVFIGSGRMTTKITECYVGERYLGSNYWCRGQASSTRGSYKGRMRCNSGYRFGFEYFIDRFQ